MHTACDIWSCVGRPSRLKSSWAGGYTYVIEKEKLGSHLSQNQTLHIYGEMQEEKLILKLRNLKELVNSEAGMDAFEQALQVETEQGNDSQNSKLRKVWRNAELVLVLINTVLILGPHYWHRRKLTVNWLASNLDVIMGMYRKYMHAYGEMLWLWASHDDNCPTFAKTRTIIQNGTSHRRKTLLEDPVIWMLRAKLRHEMLCRSFQTKLVTAIEGDTGLQKSWSYWDGIEVPKPAGDMGLINEENLRSTQLIASKHITAEKADREAITKLVKQISTLNVVRTTTVRKSPMAREVTDALGELVQALTHNASRIWKRVLADDDDADFNPDIDTINLTHKAQEAEHDVNVEVNEGADKDATKGTVNRESSTEPAHAAKNNDPQPSTKSKP
ncbi:hypothetical protein EDD22DRAFT_849873 [Suillus occidentalis]|nr:hypothetical protein EDD22DRAFT_849873 [Suillus occidentalis]